MGFDRERERERETETETDRQRDRDRERVRERQPHTNGRSCSRRCITRRSSSARGLGTYKTVTIRYKTANPKIRQSIPKNKTFNPKI